MIDLIKKVSCGADLAAELTEYCDSVTLSESGVITCRIAGDGRSEPVMLVTHIDKPYFIASGKSRDNPIPLTLIGRLAPKGSHLTPLVSENGTRAILLCNSDDKNATYSCDAGELAGNVSPGERFYIPSFAESLNPNEFFGNCASSDAIAAVLVTLAADLKEKTPSRDVYISIVPEGQQDFRLYGTAARDTNAVGAVCIGAVESSKCSDAVSVRCCDRRFSPDKALSDSLALAGAARLALAESSCGAAKLQSCGIPSSQLDLPVRHINTTAETVRLQDAERLFDVLSRFCRG